MTTYISINKHTIAKNARHGTNDPPIGVRRTKSGKASYYKKVVVNGPCELVYESNKPLLKCGERLVLVTEATVTGEM